MRGLLVLALHQSGADAIGAGGIVVAAIAAGIDEPHVVGVVGVRGAEPPVGGGNELYPNTRRLVRRASSFSGLILPDGLFYQGRLLPVPFGLCLFTELFGSAAVVLAPRSGHKFNVRHLPGPKTGLCLADNSILKANGDILQKEGAAVKNGVNLAEAAVVLGKEMGVVGGVYV